jgi:hypothetical protein
MTTSPDLAQVSSAPVQTERFLPHSIEGRDGLRIVMARGARHPHTVSHDPVTTTAG